MSSEFPPLPGGIGNHAYFLSKYLQKSEFEVEVLTDFRKVQQDIEFDSRQPFGIFRIKRNKLTQFNRFRKAIALAKGRDVVICSGKFSLWMGGILKLFFTIKSIAVLHGSELKAGGSLSQRFTKWSMAQFDSLIAVSEFTKKATLAINPKLSIEVINNGFEIGDILHKPKDAADVVNLVTVGNLTYRKGQQNVIKALPLLKERFPQIHYHCIGIPTEMEKFSTLAQSLDVIDRITFHGILSDSERNRILEKATVFVMLSQIVDNDFEGFGIAILEANALGIPVIGSQDSGIADAIKNSYSGFLVDQNKPAKVLDALQQIMDDYFQFSSQAIEWSGKFDWNLVIKKYIKNIENEA